MGDRDRAAFSNPNEISRPEDTDYAKDLLDARLILNTQNNNNAVLLSFSSTSTVESFASCSSDTDNSNQHTTVEESKQTYRMDLASVSHNQIRRLERREIHSRHVHLMDFFEQFLVGLNIKYQVLCKDNFSCTPQWGIEPYGSFLITCTRTMIRGLCALFGLAFHQDAVGVCSSYTLDNDSVHRCFLVRTRDGSRISRDDGLRITKLICHRFPQLSAQCDETGLYMEYHDYGNEQSSVTKNDLVNLLQSKSSNYATYEIDQYDTKSFLVEKADYVEDIEAAHFQLYRIVLEMSQLYMESY